MSRVQNLKVFKKCILTYIVIINYFSRTLTLLTLLTSITNIISRAILNFYPFYEVLPFSLCSLTWQKSYFPYIISCPGTFHTSVY